MLLQPFNATRPGLLVLDADGRRVASISLIGKPQPREVASGLTKALGAAPRERVLLSVPADRVAAMSKLLAAMPGVDGKPKVLASGLLETWSEAGTLTPRRLAAFAASAKHEIRTVDPVAVSIRALRDGIEPENAVKTIAGVRDIAQDSGRWTAMFHRWLFHPRHLKASGLRCDLSSVTLRFTGMPKNATAVQHLRRAMEQPGVVSIAPTLKAGTIELIVRPAEFDADATRAALVAGGLVERR